MSLNKILSFAWKEIIRSRERSYSSMIGYFSATLIFAVILLLYSGKSIDSILSNTGTHFIAFRPFCCGLPYLTQEEAKQNFIANGIQSQPLPLTLLDEVKKIPEVKDAAAFLLYKIDEAIDHRPASIGGFDPGAGDAIANTCCSANDIISGRFLQREDHNAVMLEESYAMAHALSIDSTLTIKGLNFKIVGIVNPGVRPAKADIYLTRPDAEKLISRDLGMPVKDIMNIVLVESANAHVHRIAMESVSRLMGSEGLISTYGCFKPASGAMNVNRRVLAFLMGLIFLFILVFSFKNQYVSLIARQRDLAILSSIGWSDWNISGMILFETFYQLIFGSVVGCVLFIFLIKLVPPETLVNKAINIGTWQAFKIFLCGFLSVTMAAVLAALISVRKTLYNLPAKNQILRIL